MYKITFSKNVKRVVLLFFTVTVTLSITNCTNKQYPIDEITVSNNSNPVASLSPQDILIENPSYDEIIVVCGNPGAGKSTLLNSIFQKPVFESGVSLGQGLTMLEQGHVYENKLYIDTPGLDDVELRKQAGQEIEKALRKGHRYKLFFTVTTEAGRIRPSDIATIKVIYEAIKVPIEYGVIVNKVSQDLIVAIEKKVNVKLSDMSGKNLADLINPIFFKSLDKKPSSVVFLIEVDQMKDKKNVYFDIQSEQRMKLLHFISGLDRHAIESKEVNDIQTKNFDELVDDIEKKYKKQIEELEN